MSLSNIVEKYKELLSITEVPIVLRRDPTNKFEHELEWHPKQNLWCIWYKDEPIEFYIIHELGHLYFAKRLTHFEGFALQTPFHKEIDNKLHPLLNGLLDSFVNYNLSKFDEIYPIQKQKLSSYLENFNDFKEMIDNQKDFIMLLSWYIIFFLEFNFILRKTGRVFFSHEIKRSLNYLKSSLINVKSMVFIIDFEEFNKKLSKFEDVKEKIDPKLIVLFMINVIYVLDYWTKKELLKQIKLYFPELKS